MTKPLQAGDSLTHYRIVSKLGEGGMGEVWRARDTKLGREVALKVLPEAFTVDPERTARFEREAKVLASLNHPNIAQIYGLEIQDETRALVMELVEGATLAERLERSALPLAEALAIARQIAEALEEAHERGIVHRDLKPANIKLTADDKVKVLDFGLAKALDNEVAAASGSSASQLAQSPTLTFGATQMGMILGTAAYMSPEQAAGKPVDRRADIWAFGVVLWEMLTGRRLFEGESVPETLGAVFRHEIEFDALPPTTPPAVRRLVERCLERDPKLRLRDIGEARIALAQPLAAGVEPVPRDRVGKPQPPPATADWKRSAPWAVVAIVLGLAGVWGPRLWSSKPAASEPLPLTAFGVELPPGHVLAAGEAPVLDLSRDGRLLVFEADGPSGRQLFRRRLDRVGVEPVAGTGGAVQPFLSPDGRWVGFFSGSRLAKVPFDGGSPVELATVSAYRGATWVEDGWIVYTATYSSGLVKVREAGGTPEPLTELDAARSERTHRWPAAVPDTPWVLFTVGVSNTPSFYDDSRIDAVRLDTGERKTVYEGAWMARFAPPATLLLQRRSSLVALDFDPASAEVRGSERPLLEGVGGEPSSGAGYFAAGAGATLAYVPGDALSTEKVLALVDREGHETVLPAPAKNYWYPRFSPDGRFLALDVGGGQGADDDIWLYELASGRLSRFTFTSSSLVPVWTPDGRWIVYGSASGERTGWLLRKRADGVGDEERILHIDEDMVLPNGFLPDGKSLVYGHSTTEIKLAVASMSGGKSSPLVVARENQWGAAVSPDGRYLAYTSTETGVQEVFVSTLPEGAGKWQVSTEGGQQPVWSRDGRRLSFVLDDALWEVDVELGPTFRSGAPRPLPRGPYVLRTPPLRNYDVGPDGRFVVVRRRTDVAPQRHLEVLLGWQRKLAPGATR